MSESEARGWLTDAEGDFEEAEIDPENSRPPQFACFNAQQAAEKALKAAIIAGGGSHPRGASGHELEGLVRLVPATWDVAQTDADLPLLTQLAVQPRYRDSGLVLTETDARAAVADARKIVEAARRDIDREESS